MAVPTKLKYFDNTYEFKGGATVVKVIDTNASADSIAKDSEILSKALSKHPFALILDQTLFYPQGGGQPTDTGTITFDIGGQSEAVKFAVQHVFAYQDQVYHQGKFVSNAVALDDASAVQPGCSARMYVDRDTRLRNARCHTGGHVIFSVIRGTDEWSHMNEKKGHHFADGAYVEFQGILPGSETVESFQQKIDDVVNQHMPVRVSTCKTDDGKPLRLIQVGGFLQNPCGGTHVTNTNELGRIAIKKIARRTGQNITKISYQIE
ncbi:hypothetical protein IW140_006079 [Coemansia sp. RSA 1813]|nr:hypothetical protein EV178_006038 [Coemansia sp. RSA 1646]KAJ1772965.1 hypothetical protein LPJ74_001106 [Coemansia sp. RSA 1843]KAJ2093542.1 hypothetical protein IW138_000395 [Coemansia sp. RSA 986]KAJ2210735.1 hypothetical protein EV179_006026 [Coemansia sp. RSA 487]KAJ2563521.1 hypothetical protein IW140_006079 [Coemansia sp. RSA 1813]